MGEAGSELPEKESEERLLRGGGLFDKVYRHISSTLVGTLTTARQQMVFTVFTLGVLLLQFQFNFAFPEIVGPDVELREKKSFASFKFRPVGK